MNIKISNLYESSFHSGTEELFKGIFATKLSNCLDRLRNKYKVKTGDISKELRQHNIWL